MNHLVLCLQFHQADRATAMRLARLIADIEPQPRLDMEFVMVARFDTDHDPETLEYVAKKFPRTTWFTTHTRWTGWPAGCNAMAKDTLEWIAANRKNAVALLIEPDVIPVCADWINRLMSVWSSIDACSDGSIMLAGAWRDSGGEFGHINGNMLCRGDLADLIDLSVIDEHMAWDCLIVSQVKHLWANITHIKNCFDSKNATETDLFWARIGTDAPALVHGYKDDSAYNLVVQHLLHPDTSELSL